VAALTPKAEIEGEMGEPQMGLQARLMSQALREAHLQYQAQPTRGHLHQPDPHEDRRCCSAIPRPPPAATRSSSMASVRMDIRRIGSIKKGDEVVGSETRVKVVKNKVARLSSRPSSTSCTAVHFARRRSARDRRQSRRAREVGRLVHPQRRPAGQGKDNARDFLKETPSSRAEIEAKIREKAGIAKPAPAAGEPAEEKKVEHLATRKRG